MKYPARMAIYLAVIALAPTLHDPWMVALQAGLGGILLGMRLEQWRNVTGNPVWAYNMRVLIAGSAIILIPVIWVFIWWVKS